jgi:N-acetylglucosaminyldiphosphoundecaprenol N-acetyl-beta-D-mannosaminyltransferase
MLTTLNIITLRTHVLSFSKAISTIEKLAKNKKGGYVCVSNVHMCMETFDSSEFKSILDNSDLTIADGRPIYWAQKLLGEKKGEHIRGQDLTDEICRVSGHKHLNIGLYGGSSVSTLEKVESALLEKFPDIKISFKYSPPYRQLTCKENEDIVQAVTKADVDILFVAIGCPKQEIWMAENKKSLSCVMIGVGAAFDFISGAKKHSPYWMQKVGMEWLYRLFSEPGRLWRRYLIQNPRFLFYFFLQLLNR